jgi:hypothetical protein
MKTLVYGTKMKFDGIFLTAFSLESKDAKAFAARFESELRKETQHIVGVRLWREEQEGDRLILIGWYDYDHGEANDILGGPPYLLELIESAIENTARDFGYQTVRKTHSSQVPLAASSGNRRLASELVAVAEMLATEKTAMYQPTSEFKSMVGWKTIAFRETEKVSNEIENVLADLETYVIKGIIPLDTAEVGKTGAVGFRCRQGLSDDSPDMQGFGGEDKHRASHSLRGSVD